MHLARHHSAVAAVTLGVLAFFAPSLMASQSAGWAVTVAVNAVVDHGENTATTPVAIGGKVVDGDRLTTGAGGALVLSRGEDLVTMAENSRIVIVDPQPNGATLIDQPYGNVEYHVTKEVVPHFEVDTPLLATIVKGTTFSVSASESQHSVDVSEGRVEAKNRGTGATASVGAGQMGSVTSGTKEVNVGAGSTNASAGASSTNSMGANSANSNAGGGDKGGHGGGRGEGSGRSDRSSAGNSGNGNGNGNGNGADPRNGHGNNGHGHGHGNGGN